MSAKEYCVDNGLVFGNQYNFGYLLMSTGKRHDVFPMCVALAYLCKKAGIGIRVYEEAVGRHYGPVKYGRGKCALCEVLGDMANEYGVRTHLMRTRTPRIAHRGWSDGSGYSYSWERRQHESNVRFERMVIKGVRQNVFSGGSFMSKVPRVLLPTQYVA